MRRLALLRHGGMAVSLVWRADPLGSVMSSALQAVRVALLVAFVWAAALAVDGVVQTGATGTAANLVVPVVVIAVLSAAASIASLVQAQRERLLDEKIGRVVWDRVLDVTTTVDLTHYDSPEFTDRLDRIATNIFGKPVDVARATFSLAGAAAGTLALAAALILLDWVVIVPLAIAAVPATWCAVAVSRAEYRFSVAMHPCRRRLEYIRELMEYKPHAAELRAFQTANALRERHEALSTEYGAALAAVERVRRRWGVLGALASGIGLVAAVLVVARHVDLDALTLAEAGAVLVAARLLGGELARAFSHVTALTGALPFLRELQEFSDDFERTPVTSVAMPLQQGIELSHVSYTYPGAAEPALRDVSLSLVAGQTVALVGANGSGKSTLAAIVAGLYVPDAGDYRWDGEALADSRRVRASVACLFQDFDRYHLTTRENIFLGVQGDRSRDADILEAAGRAGAGAIVENLPHGLDTPLGNILEPGAELSAGEWQRLALARTLYRDAPLVVLDEPTAALDPAAEAALFRDLRATLHGRTGLLITHRYSSARQADRIVVLHDGEVVESGTHAELLAAGGHYAAMSAL